MRKTTLFIGLIALLLLAACVQDECKGNDSCYFSKAMSLNDTYYCSRISNPSIEKSCKAEIAIQRQDIELCRTIESGYCVTSIAEMKLDTTICKATNDAEWHATCLNNIAVRTGDSNVCREITSDDKRDECFEIVAKETNKTESCYFIVDQEKRDLCINKVAMTTRNSNDCYNIQDGLIKSKCYLTIAVSANKPKICESIPLRLIREDCREQLSGK